MNKATEDDLKTLTEIFEDFARQFDKLKLPDQIDLAARLKPIAKACEDIDKKAKAIVKDIRKGVEGEVPGKLFKGCLTIVPVDRLQQKLLQEEKPKIYEQYLRHDEDERVTFKLR